MGRAGLDADAALGAVLLLLLGRGCCEVRWRRRRKESGKVE